MWISELPAFVPFYLAALLVLLTKGWLRNLILLATPVVAGLHLWLEVEPGLSIILPLANLELTIYRTDRLSLLFGYLFHIAYFIAAVFALHVRDTSQHVVGLLYAGSAVGAVFAGDLLTLFIFWELLAITSVFFIWARHSDRSLQAGIRYLLFQITSGMLLLAGTLIIYSQTNSLTFEHIGLNGIGSWLIFLAFGIKCAFPFLHNWLTDAYPEATPTGTVFLSAFTTKVAVYALARGFAGTEILVYIGAVMTCFPIFYAVIENDLRRVLAYSMINQVGFMVCGIGIGTALAMNGAVAHAFTDVIFKGLLFMTMGAVLYRTGNINGSDLGGLYKTMPKTAVLCIIGAASISAFPLFSGFVSKSMVMSAMLIEGYDYLWLMLLFASAGVFHHAGIKIPYFAFFAHDSGIRTQEAPWNMLLAMTIAAVLCIVIGSQPQYLYNLLPWEMDYWPYDMTHVLAQIQLLFFSALAFVWLNKQGLYPPELHSVNLDAEWVYRSLLPASTRALMRQLNHIRDRILVGSGIFLQNSRQLLGRFPLTDYHL
ncbi:MAG: Na(+)/H(+) antiporter subunit D, partial [Gammaproteobacteria bacterium]|nr:Na(+)/H(+) antiporter subunit D [Gammaproteobacteria bacterium]